MSEEQLTEKPGYYAVIPANIRYDKNLSPNAKLMYGEITCLLNFRNKCFASNKYFARLYEISEVQVSRIINQLIKAGHVVSEVENTRNGTQRLLKLALNINVNQSNNKNDLTPLNKNVNHNNQSINNKSLSNDNDATHKKFSVPSLQEISEYFIEKGITDKNEHEKFNDFYASKGWMVGKNKMKDWKAAIRNFIKGIKTVQIEPQTKIML